MDQALIVIVLLMMSGQFGVALAATLIVHPVLNSISKSSALEAFKPFFHKTHNTMIVLSIATTLVALAISISTKNWWWFGIAMLMHLNGPYTIVFMMPTNRRLMADDVNPNSAETAHDLANWGKLHAVRTVLNGVILLGLLLLAVY